MFAKRRESDRHVFLVQMRSPSFSKALLFTCILSEKGWFDHFHSVFNFHDLIDPTELANSLNSRIFLPRKIPQPPSPPPPKRSLTSSFRAIDALNNTPPSPRRIPPSPFAYKPTPHSPTPPSSSSSTPQNPYTNRTQNHTSPVLFPRKNR